MALGDNRFSDVTGRISTIFEAQSVTVQVVVSSAGQSVKRDRFGEPTDPPPAPVNVQIVMDEVTEDIKPTAEGGQPTEQLRFFALPGTMNENDMVIWNGHDFRISSLWPSTFGTILQVLYGKADRMVGT